jgi:hypothetical protein
LSYEIASAVLLHGNGIHYGTILIGRGLSPSRFMPEGQRCYDIQLFKFLQPKTDVRIENPEQEMKETGKVFLDIITALEQIG